MLNEIRAYGRKFTEALVARTPFRTKLAKKTRNHFKIGIAVLAHERPEYLEVCLDSLFATKLYNYNVTFLIHDDGSSDPKVREIIERERSPEYRIVRHFEPRGHDSWGGAFNCAMRKLLEFDDFDIVASCDSDALFHPDWLDQTLRVCLWAKKHHKNHVLGPFSSFNSSDYLFHEIMGTYSSPYGNYVVKKRMGALKYFYFKEDLLTLGFFEEHRDDETRMTERFDVLKVRNFCTETSFVEHLGHSSILNAWRPVPVSQAVHGMNLAEEGWPEAMKEADTLGYYKYVNVNCTTDGAVSSTMKLDVVIPVIEKDLDVLPLVIDGVVENLRHPLQNIIVVAPDSESIKAVCRTKGCRHVDEATVLPISKSDIDYVVDGTDRSGWLFQQLLKLSGDVVSSQENFLVVDADTVLLQPQVFEVGGRQLLLHSDEYHKPYFDVFRRLSGRDAASYLSFVSHTMLFQQKMLAELKTSLEKTHHLPWYDVIVNFCDKADASGFSEYETYGQWMLLNHPEKVIREYWFNTTLRREKLADLPSLKRRLSGKYRMVSFHSYMN